MENLLLGTTQGIFSLLDQRDVDKTLNQFLKYFQYEFLPNIPTNILADPRKLIKHIRDFNLSRGSEDSYKLLFRILYNDSVDFYYPKTNIMIPSDGKWSIDTVIRTTTVNDTSQFISKTITGVTSGATANVENVILKTIGSSVVSEIYLSNIVGNFEIGENISVNVNGVVLVESVYGLATGIILTNPGTAYNSNDIIGVIGANKTALFSVNVSGNVDIGRVVQSSFENYTQSALIQLSSNASNINGYYNNMLLTITDGSGSGQTKKIIGYNGSNNVAILDTNWLELPDITSHYSINLGNIKSIKVNDFGINYTTPIAADFSLSGNNNATGMITVGAIGYYSGHYVNNDGFLSDKKYLQDSYFYQNYSYVLKTHELLSDYINVVKKLLHPSGLLLFGNKIIDNTNFIRKTHIPSCDITTSSGGALPTSGLIAQYQMLENILNTQLLYDVRTGFYPTGNNATLGRLPTVDSNDPSWNSNGLIFTSSFVNVNTVPVNNTQQTIIVVFKVNSLLNNESILGSIDISNDSGISGYKIFINSDGSLNFRTQKMVGGTPYNLEIAYPSGSINATDYFFTSLRYYNNTLVVNLNSQTKISTTYNTNVDSLSVLNNSSGYYLGVGGYSVISRALYNLNRNYNNFSNRITYKTTPNQTYFNGIIAYCLFYDRFLSDSEIIDSYTALKINLQSRGIYLP